MKNLKKLLSLALALSMSLTVMGCSGNSTGGTDKGETQETVEKEENTTTTNDKKYKIATVSKNAGSAWFERMATGVERFADETGHESFQIDPQKADAALQVQVIEDLIAQDVDAICVVPFSLEALEPVLKKAREQGIIVVSHEAAGIQNVDYDLEAFSNDEYGAHFMDELAKLVEEEGEYATMVGSLTSKSHVEWVEGALARQKEKYPNMKLVAEKVETYEDQMTAYDKAKEIIKANPNIKGFIGSSVNDLPGIALAIEEMGKEEQIQAVGTSLASVSSQFLKNGAADLASFWDPADAAYAMNEIAVKLLNGETLSDGLQLETKGYEKLTLKGNVFYAQAWVDLRKENADEYDF